MEQKTPYAVATSSATTRPQPPLPSARPLAELLTPLNKKIVAVALFTFLTTFALSRLTVYLVIDKILPNLFLTIRGVHIHHFTYGVVILAVVGLFLLVRRPTPGSTLFTLLNIAYGAGLGLTFDEFGMWIRLEDNYWIRQSYDAIVIVTLLLLNVRFYRSLRRALIEIWRLLIKTLQAFHILR